MSLLSSPTGHLVNLSTASPGGEVVAAPVSAPGLSLVVSGETTASVGTAVVLTVRAVGASEAPIDRYNRVFSDGRTQSGDEVSVSFAAAGVYTVDGRAGNRGDCDHLGLGLVLRAAGSLRNRGEFGLLGGIVRFFLKKSVLLSKSHRILERKSLEKFITTTFGSVLGAVLTQTGLDRAFVAGARALCDFVSLGLTDADLKFRLQADAGRFNLQVSNGGLLTPKNGGSGDFQLGCPEGFNGIRAPPSARAGAPSLPPRDEPSRAGAGHRALAPRARPNPCADSTRAMTTHRRSTKSNRWRNPPANAAVDTLKTMAPRDSISLPSVSWLDPVQAPEL